MSADGATAQVDIDILEILHRIPHRYPMLLVDRAEDYRPHESIVGIKCVTINEPFFTGHFPGNPVMPGVLICEAIAQTGAVLMSKSLNADVSGKTIMIVALDDVRFRHPVRPGDVLRMPVEVIRHRGDMFKFKGRAMVGDKLAAQVEFAAMVVNTPRPVMAKIHSTAIVADGAALGAEVEIGPYCLVGEHVTLGDGVRLMAHVVVEGETQIGEACVVHPFAVLGGAPQHSAHKGEVTRLVIGAHNAIREHVTMHTGTVSGRGVTVVGSHGLFMAGSHVAHDCIVGDNVVMANNATLGGHVHMADFVFMGGLAAAHQYSRIGRYSFIGGLAAVTKDVIPFGSVWGNHAHLEGLNLVGLRRRGFSRETINQLRAAYRLLFADEGTFQERLADVAETYASSTEVMEIVGFIQADANRPLCLPGLD